MKGGKERWLSEEGRWCWKREEVNWGKMEGKEKED